ncbi:glycerophosphodiester phosphodiesterase [Angustibacter sp. McL0619]|uniref:glycerophosphodiester phosphodiesterase n=1 Tax=Angustibacter sp. McL0619 TaxID=3415676 RepID=UPI003CECEBDA
MTRSLVIGHRGAAGYRPEHTLASYELAARMGADFIEPDLVCTKDGVLVARHENEIGGTTDVPDRAEFATRRTTKVVDGLPVTGWFTEDFTLAELKTLRAKERLPLVRPENTVYDGFFDVPTFDEVLALRGRLTREWGRTIGIYPETKHPTYFRSIGLAPETELVRSLTRAGLNSAQAPVFVQSFELSNLVRLNAELGLRARSVFLTAADGAPYDLVAAGDPRTYRDLITAEGLKQLRRKGIDGLGPDKTQVIGHRADGSLGEVTSLVRDAHEAGLVVHPYTFRAENQFLPADLRVGTDPNASGRAIDEQIAFLRTGIDGLFTDQADIGVLARSLSIERGRRPAA